MNICIGEWYLCEAYIDEPVRVEALEADRIQLYYLIKGKTRWLGYPRIWQACKPQALSRDLSFDSQGQMIIMRPGDDASTAAQLLSLSELRAQRFPHLVKKPAQKAKKPTRSRVSKVQAVNWGADLLWEEEEQEDSDSLSDEQDFALEDAGH